MLIYKNKKTKELYACLEIAHEKGQKFLHLQDQYMYTIPLDEMEFIINDKILHTLLSTQVQKPHYSCKEEVEHDIQLAWQSAGQYYVFLTDDCFLVRVSDSCVTASNILRKSLGDVVIEISSEKFFGYVVSNQEGDSPLEFDSGMTTALMETMKILKLVEEDLNEHK